MRNPQLMLDSAKKLKVATGAWWTIQVPPVSVDSYIFTNTGSVKSSKNMWGVPWLSTTRSENCVFKSFPLASAGGPKGSPAPGEVATRIAEEDAGTVAFPSVHGWSELGPEPRETRVE